MRSLWIVGLVVVLCLASTCWAQEPPSGPGGSGGGTGGSGSGGSSAPGNLEPNPDYPVVNEPESKDQVWFRIANQEDGSILCENNAKLSNTFPGEWKGNIFTEEVWKNNIPAKLDGFHERKRMLGVGIPPTKITFSHELTEIPDPNQPQPNVNSYLRSEEVWTPRFWKTFWLAIPFNNLNNLPPAVLRVEEDKSYFVAGNLDELHINIELNAWVNQQVEVEGDNGNHILRMYFEHPETEMRQFIGELNCTNQIQHSFLVDTKYFAADCVLRKNDASAQSDADAIKTKVVFVLLGRELKVDVIGWKKPALQP